MTEYGWRMTPPQAVALEVQTADDRGCGSHGVERTEGVLDEVRVQLTVTAHRSSDVRLGFEQQGVPTCVSQAVRRHQPVRAAADDDRIHLRRERHVCLSPGSDETPFSPELPGLVHGGAAGCS